MKQVHLHEPAYQQQHNWMTMRFAQKIYYLPSLSLHSLVIFCEWKKILNLKNEYINECFHLRQQMNVLTRGKTRVKAWLEQRRRFAPYIAEKNTLNERALRNKLENA